MEINRTVIRNVIIVAVLASLGVVWSAGFSTITAGLSQIILVLFVFAMIGFGYQYFRRNELAWSVISQTRRRLMIGCAVGIALLLVAGFPLLSPVVGPLAVIALIAVLAATIAWIVYDSRRFHA